MNIIRRAALAGLTISLLAVTGCSTATPESQPSSSPTTIATRTPTPSPTPKPPAGKTLSLTCNWSEPATKPGELAKYMSGSFDSVQEAWASGHLFGGCEAELSTMGVYSTDELAAVSVAYPDDPKPEKVKYLWGICADNAHFYQTNGPINDTQRLEAAGALMLCPDHPSAAVMANGSQEQQERDNGLRFGSGVFEVGTRIQPGTYRASGAIQNCYWERLDSTGQIIDNNFVSAATQVEVTIQLSDFSVHFDGCGEFVKVR